MAKFTKTEEFIDLTKAAWPKDVSPSSQAWLTDKLRAALYHLAEQEIIKTDLYAACKRGHQRLLEMGQKESHRTVSILKAALAKADVKDK